MNAQTPTQVTSLPNAVGQASDTIAQEANRFGELARSWWNRNADFLRDAAGAMRDEASAFGSRTRLYVKDEPVKSVLAAAIVGAAITGLLMMAIKRDR
jgi:ElaB/YqjD/DUF883 family membrane-anchored ribosome-binding protein